MSPARKIQKRSTPLKGVPGPAMIPEKALIMSGFGINSEMETQEVLARAGMDADIVHINDLIGGEIQPSRLPAAGLPRRILVRRRYRCRQCLCQPGAEQSLEGSRRVP